MQRKLKDSLKKFFTVLLYGNDTRLLTLPGKKDRDWFINQGFIGTVFALMTGATYLTGLFNKVNAPEVLIGYIPILGTVAGMLTIFAGYLMQRIRSRKRFILISNTIIKTLLVLTAWVPLVYSGPLASYTMIAMSLIAYALNNFMAIAINSWFVDLIDVKIRGRYMSVRNKISLIAHFLIPIIISSFIDSSKDQYIAILIVFSLSWIMMWLESFSFYKIHEPEVKKVRNKIKFKDVFLVPIKNKEFMGFMTFVSTFYFIWYIAMSYNILYQLNYLGLSYTFLSLAAILNVLLQFIWYPFIGKVVDKYNTDLLLIFCFIAYFVDSLMWGFTGMTTRYIMTIIVNITASITGPFFSITLFTKKYAIIPQEDRSLYDGFYTATIATIIAIAPMVGGLLKGFIENNVNAFFVFEVPQFQLLFLTTNFLLLILVLTKSKKMVKLIREEKQKSFEPDILE